MSGHRSGAPDAAATALAYLRVTTAAAREWRRLGTVAVADRVALVADTVWTHGYTLGHDHTYRALADQVSRAAAEAAAGLDGRGDPGRAARVALRRVGFLAHSIAAAPPRRPHPPTAHATIAAATRAIQAHPSGPPWKAVVDAVWCDACRTGAMHGALQAGHELIATWRTAVRARERATTVRAGTVTTWLYAELATTTWETALPWLGRTSAPLPTAPASRPTAHPTAADVDLLPNTVTRTHHGRTRR